MSDILIKGMKMPTSCSDCKIRLSVGCCGNLPQNTRMPNCPLVHIQPHGRLIDADALFKAFQRAEWYNNADRDEVADAIVLDAPTIIPSDKEEA